MAAIELRTYLLAVYRVRDARVGAMDNSQNVAFFRVRNPRMGSLHSIEDPQELVAIDEFICVPSLQPRRPRPLRNSGDAV